MATPAEVLDAIEGHLAERTQLVSHAPIILGVPGRAVGADDDGPLFAYDKRRMRKIRAVIYEAARHDLGGADG